MNQNKEIYDYLNNLGAPFVLAVSDRGEDLKVICSNHINSCLEATFPTYSLTKTFISVLILKSFEDNNLSLNNELGDYIQDLPANWLKNLKIKNLLTHRAGLADYEYCQQYKKMVRNRPSERVDENVLINMVTEQGMKFPEGENFQYANIGYLYLQKVIEIIYKSTFPQILKDKICLPLNLENTAVALQLNDLKRLTFKTLDSESIGGGDVRKKYSPSLVAHGLITSNIKDLAVFFNSIFLGDFLNKDSKLILNNPIKLEYPSEIIDSFYGVGVMGDPDSQIGSFLGHDGGGPGYSISAYHQKMNGIEKDFFLIFGKENIRGIDVLVHLISSIPDQNHLKSL